MDGSYNSVLEGVLRDKYEPCLENLGLFLVPIIKIRVLENN